MNRPQRSLVVLGVSCALPSLLLVTANATTVQDVPQRAQTVIIVGQPAPGVIDIQKAEAKPAEGKKDDTKKGEARKGEEKKGEAKEKDAPVEKDKAVKAGVVLDVKMEAVQAGEAVAVEMAAPVMVVQGMAVNGNNLDPLIQQFTQQFRPVLRTELHFLKTVCAPTKEQKQKIALEGDKALKAAVKKYAQNQQQMMNGQWRGGQQPDPRKLIQQGLLAAVKANLTPEQSQSYLAEIDRRNQDLKSVSVRNLVARIDQDLVLTADQREQLAAALHKDWKDAWGGSLEMFMYGNEYLPVLPDKLIAPILTPVQKKVWSGAQKTQVNAFFGGMGFLGGVEMDADPVDEEVFAELRKQEEAEAKKLAEAKAKLHGPPKPVDPNNAMQGIGVPAQVIER